MNKKTHGGRRENAGRHNKSKEGARKQITFYLNPSNFAFLTAKGEEKQDYINFILDKERKNEIF